jgi:hypothetical protein
MDKVNNRINLPLNNMRLSKHAPFQTCPLKKHVPQKKRPGIAGSF